jgi:lipopolysaccharide/colanic/teichoic acid biosynthesis glycosyltransferase
MAGEGDVVPAKCERLLEESEVLCVKRIFDVLASIFLLLLFSPIMLLEALVVRVALGRPVIFRQRRPGLHGKLFTLYKFRTMTDARGPNGELLPDEERHSTVGHWLIQLSVDELPELYNVLKGDMSLVGPRPLLEDYLERYTLEQARRHAVKPGITGLAQISGRQALTFGQRIAKDIYYVEHWSLWLDLKILLLTIPKVILRRGIKPDQQIDEVDDIGLSPESTLGRNRA